MHSARIPAAHSSAGEEPGLQADSSTINRSDRVAVQRDFDPTRLSVVVRVQQTRSGPHDDRPGRLVV